MNCHSATAQFISAANKNDALNRSQFFTTDQPLEMILSSDFKKLKSEKRKGALQKATVTLYIPGRDSIKEEIQINARGQYRREICQMPSLMINFKNPGAVLLSSLKKMKLVCGCGTNSSNEELVLMEYLAYKIYNLIAEMSFKVRLVHLSYRDVSNNVKPYTQYAFFIEDVDDMAKRNACREYQYKAATQIINRTQMTTVALFEYMIGNTDWSVPNYHNIKLIRSVLDSTTTPYAVPYDFDFAGLVDAPYAFPNEAFPIEKVTQRLYRGFARSLDEIETALQPFREKKGEIRALILGFEMLNKKARGTMIKYLD
ncbi:MAG: hypothetical protein M3Y85_01120, partial [Bacteroidota bacterium]|nr:hypothetical protein [Bacteroidota bacterium]